MKKKNVVVSGRSFQVPRLSVQDCMDICDSEYEWHRSNLKQDLKESGASSEESIAALREMTDKKGLMSLAIRSAFTIRGAINIISSGYEGNFPEQFNELSMESLSEIALHMLGFDPASQEEEKSAEGNESKPSDPDNG
jgi:hypothetical protein